MNPRKEVRRNGNEFTSESFEDSNRMWKWRIYVVNTWRMKRSEVKKKTKRLNDGR